ncbi:MAG: hypothetical protein AAGD09_03505 [Cyanobacteria bacterium P01_F01_bin.56]
MKLTPLLFFEVGALVELYNDAIAAAKDEESQGGPEVTGSEMLGVAIAVGGPLLQRFFIPSLPDSAIEKAATSIAEGLGVIGSIRAKAALILDEVENTGKAALNVIK